MTKQGKLQFTNGLPSKDTRKHKIEDRYSVIEPAGRHTRKGDISRVSHQKHGHRKG